MGFLRKPPLQAAGNLLWRPIVRQSVADGLVEFGLIQTEDGVKAYGAGMLSSFGETQFSVDSTAPNRIGFDLERVMRTRYKIDTFQNTYFVLPSFDKLFRDSIDTDFGPLYEKLKALEPYAPDAVVDGDTVLHRGTGSAP